MRARGALAKERLLAMGAFASRRAMRDQRSDRFGAKREHVEVSPKSSVMRHTKRFCFKRGVLLYVKDAPIFQACVGD